MNSNIYMYVCVCVFMYIYNTSLYINITKKIMSHFTIKTTICKISTSTKNFNPEKTVKTIPNIKLEIKT